MVSDGNQYDADYFLRGKETGKSLYSDYRWLPELTIPMCAHIASHLELRKKDTPTILDFGCARGYTVKAFRSIGYAAWGYDVSKWAMDNADPAVKEYLLHAHCIGETTPMFDWVIAKDVLEHIGDAGETVKTLMMCAKQGVFAVVPLASLNQCRQYDVPEYEADITHVHRRPLSWWVALFHREGWSVEARYRLPGVKDNYAQYPTGNGFITARRIE